MISSPKWVLVLGPEEDELKNRCLNKNCSKQIKPRQQAWKYGSGVCCNIRCFAEAIGAKAISASKS